MSNIEWVNDVFGDADLGDARRSQRLIQLSHSILESPETTLSQAMGSGSKNKASHRFFSNDSFESSEISNTVIESTLSKINKKKRVLLIQDSSHLNYDNLKATKGLGHIGSTKDRSFQGIMMHWTLALDGSSEPLGLLDLKLWERKKDPRKPKLNSHQSIPIEKKESYKWIKPVDTLDGLIDPSVQAIWVSDRESDIYEFIGSVKSKDQDFVVRSNNDRILTGDEVLLKEKVRSSKVVGLEEITVEGSRRKQVKVEVEIRSCSVELAKPNRRGGARSQIENKNEFINVVSVKSKSKKIKLEWILLTTLPVSTLKDCNEVVWIYNQRWHIESIHKTLKSGFKTEELAMNTAKKLERAITIYLPCAIRIYWLCYRQRFYPDERASKILTKTECKILAKLNNKRSNYVPSVKEAWFWIGLLGGFRGNKNAPPPGQITFWRGYKKLKDLAAGADLMN